MILVIDVGNTRSKWAFFEKGELNSQGSYNNNEALPENFNALDKNVEVIVSSVSGITEQLSQALGRFSKVLKFNETTPIPIKLAYESRETLGSDRVANAVAAHSTFPKRNTLVIDAGTCITFDLIDGSGVYHGGSISPGLNMRVSALNNYTEALPLVELATPKRLVGGSTEQSIISGVINGATAELNGLVELYTKEFKNLKVVLTGGDILWFEHALKNETFADAFFTLRGLQTILEYNRSHT